MVRRCWCAHDVVSAYQAMSKCGCIGRECSRVLTDRNLVLYSVVSRKHRHPSRAGSTAVRDFVSGGMLGADWGRKPLLGTNIDVDVLAITKRKPLCTKGFED